MSRRKKYAWDETGVGESFLVPVPEGVNADRLQNVVCAAARSRRKRSVIMGRTAEQWATTKVKDEALGGTFISVSRVA